MSFRFCNPLLNHVEIPEVSLLEQESKMANLRKRVGQRILQLRQEAGLTQEVLAEHLDLHGSYVGLLERGVKTPSLETLRRIAEFFDLDISDLLAEDDEAQVGDNKKKRIGKLLEGAPKNDIDKLYWVLRILFDRQDIRTASRVSP